MGDCAYRSLRSTVFLEVYLKQDWHWLNIIRVPRVRSLPDVLSASEVARLINAAQKLRYRVFILATYSMGLRLSETLSLQVCDIDGERHRVHIRRGKGHKDRFVPLPDVTYQALRHLWRKHCHPTLLFPSPAGSAEHIRQATQHMSHQGVQNTAKAMNQIVNVLTISGKQGA